MKYCKQCGEKLLDESLYCKKCGCKQSGEFQTNENKPINKAGGGLPHMLIPVIVSCLLVISVGVFLIVSKKDNDQHEQDITEIATDTSADKTSKSPDSISTEVTAQEVSENESKIEQKTTAEEKTVEEPYYLVDYAVLTKMTAQEANAVDDGSREYDYRDTNQIISCELCDSNKDGFLELYIDKHSTDGRPISYIFAPYNKAGITVNTYLGAASQSELRYSESLDKPLFYWQNGSNGLFADDYSFYEDNDLKEFCSYRLDHIPEKDKDGIFAYHETMLIDGKREEEDYVVDNLYEHTKKKIFDDYEKNLKIRKMNNHYKSVTRLNFKQSVTDVRTGLEKHFKELNLDYMVDNKDINGDGKEDMIFAINGYASKWFDNINVIQGGYEKELYVEVFPHDTVLLCLVSVDSGTIVVVEPIRRSDVVALDINSDIVKITSSDGGVYDYGIDWTEDATASYMGKSNAGKIEKILLENYLYFPSPQAEIFLRYSFHSNGTYNCDGWYTADGTSNEDELENPTGTYYVDEDKKLLMLEGQTYALVEKYNGFRTKVYVSEYDPSLPETPENHYEEGYNSLIPLPYGKEIDAEYIWEMEYKYGEEKTVLD